MLSIYEQGEVIFSASETIQGEPGSDQLEIGPEASKLLNDLAAYLTQQNRAAPKMAPIWPWLAATVSGKFW